MARKTGWADEELAGIDLGDERRNERARRLLTRFAEKPTQSIVGASHGWSETMAAYRFVGNDAFEWHDIMQPHWERTHERRSRESIVLCLDDTTELDFNGQAIEGLGPLNYETRRGMYLHPTYAVSPERVPLGVLNAWMWSRKPKTEDGERHDIKESTRWIEGYERIAEMAAELPTTRLVYVADREADILALMRRADELDTPADWLIRAKHNRSLEGGEKLWRKVEQTEAVGELKFQMASRPGQRARTVKQEIRVRSVALPAKTGVLEVTCIVATEVDPPAGMKPVQWRLLTNREATGLDELVTLIDWYRARWEIEMFFNVLKNGCKVEAMQLSMVDRLERALALFMIVAWRIAYLMRLGRTCPDLDATLFFDQDEIRGAYLLMNKRRPPQPPRLNEVVRLVAQCGGFLARKGDGEPGAKTIWEGLQRVMTAAEAIRALRSEGALA